MILAAAPHRNAQPGDIITFGIYPQIADGADSTPITWRVLQNAGGDLFVLSEFILDCKRYHGEFVDVAWRDCDLRTWLNDQFYHAAFDENEKSFIKTTRCTDNGAGSPDTDDKVFLLGVAEVKRLTDMHDAASSGITRRAIGTAFAIAHKADGCHLYVYDKSVSADYVTENGKQYGCSWWWLRTQPSSASRAAFVGARSSVRGYARVNRTGYGVRPALTLSTTA